MTEHTPKLDAKPGEDALCYVCGATRHWINRTLPNLSHWEECAMHKAAPDLLAALEMARECIAYCRRSHPDVQTGEGVPVEYIIDDAIAKAKGQT